MVENIPCEEQASFFVSVDQVRYEMTSKSPLSQFTRITGRYSTLGTFIPAPPESNQESITGAQRVDVNLYHTKLYTRNKPVTVQLGNGIQDGQLKKLTFVFKGSESGNITVECPALASTNTEIIFSNVGDQCTLMWTGGYWSVLETLNVTNPSLQSPWVR